MKDLYVVAALLALLLVGLSELPGASAESQAYTPEQLIEAASGDRSFGGDPSPLTADIERWWSCVVQGVAAATGPKAIAVADQKITLDAADDGKRAGASPLRGSRAHDATPPRTATRRSKRGRLSDSETSTTPD